MGEFDDKRAEIEAGRARQVRLDVENKYEGHLNDIIDALCLRVARAEVVIAELNKRAAN